MPLPYKHIAIIYNPNSTGDAESNARKLSATLRKKLANVKVELLPTEHAGHAIELAYDYAKRHRSPLIVSASGDGGYNEVINGAMRARDEGADPITAVLPSGNANDHARTLQQKPLSGLIIDGAVRDIDLLRIMLRPQGGKPQIRYAHSYAGIGITPTVAVELNKQTLNAFKEAIIILKTFWGHKPVAIEAGGKKIYVDSLICSTVPGMAKVLTFSDKVWPEDGLFELTTFEHNRKIKLLFRLIKGAIRHLGTQTRLRKYEFRLLKPAPIQLDGEVMELQANTAVRIEISEQPLRTVV